jgi:transposase
MEVVYHRCAGVDVHQRFLVVCLSGIEAGKRHKEIRSFRNETADLLALRAWLLQEGCSAVGMESTGVRLHAGVSAFGGLLRADCG